jgi:ferrous-iron efflux pump FieF
VKSLKVAALISAVLAVAKGCAFAWTGSVVVLASFLDSLVDTFLSFVNFKISRLSQERADRQHPYGHGGFEVITSLLQGILIAGSGLMVWFQSLDRIFSPKSIENLSLERLPVALVIMIVSTIGAFVITAVLARSRKEVSASDQRSLSLNADHAHYAGDVWQNLVTIFGVAASWWFKSPLADVFAGLLAGLILLRAAYPLLKESARDILNTESDPKLREQVQKIVNGCGVNEVKGMHRLRTRTLGPNRFADFHLKLPNNIPLIEAHEISYRIEALLRKSIPGIDVLIHLDPEAEPDEDFDEE